MSGRRRSLLLRGAFLAALCFAGVAPAQDPTSATNASAVAPPSAPAQRSPAELEKLAMPIALYPDPLLAIMLPASVYPLEIVQAARFVKDTNNIPKIDDQPWDENVKEVARIPEVIHKMNDDLSLTIELGQAFLDQQKELMDTIQALRLKAQKAGTLQTTPQQVVSVTNMVVVQTNVTQIVYVTNQIVEIQPANPQVIYVPTYPYTVYYPPPAYVYNPYAPLITFGVGVAVGAIIANNCNWYHGCVYRGGYYGNVNINVNRNVNINRNVNVGARPTPYGGGAGQRWQPDQNRLRNSGAPSTLPSAGTREARGWGSGPATPSQLPSGGAGASRPDATAPTTRPTTTPGNLNRPATTPGQTPGGSRPSAGQSYNRPSTQPNISRPSSTPSQNNAFGGMSSGSSTYSASQRGSASRGGGFSGGARGGGGGRR
jgi:hypothetical protein